jgi:hypothetical protein
VTIFNKRNALVGFITLKALERRKWRRRRSTLRLAAFVGLGLVSAGILAALLAVALRRSGKADEELEVAEFEAELEEALDAAMPEPGFAE